MGFKYLGDENWINFSREERLFCAHLYWRIRNQEHNFIKWLNENTSLDLEEDCEWEVGYEVCFYRDYYFKMRKFLKNESIKKSAYSGKRTFDLCMFSPNKILIIEAKVQQKFKEEQLKDIVKDIESIKKLLGNDIKVNLIALASLEYYENLKIYGGKGGVKSILDKFFTKITWKEMDNLFEGDIFGKADEKYKQ